MHINVNDSFYVLPVLYLLFLLTFAMFNKRPEAKTLAKATYREAWAYLVANEWHKAIYY